jgi:hypothetical protein
VRFHVVVAPEIERLAHGVNVSLSEKREDVALKARSIGHESKYLKNIVDGTVRLAGPDCDNAVHPLVSFGAGLEHRIHPEIVARGIDWLSPLSFSITLGGPVRKHV